MDWFEAERGWYSPRRELQRLKRRARARWALVVVVAAALCGVALYKLSRAKGVYTARVIMRVTEADLLRDESPIVGRGLADYLLDAALRSGDVAVLLRKHGIYKRALAVSESYAASLFRADLRLDVYRNYFAVGRGYSQGTRTARISIRYSDSDRDRALLIARDVAELLAATETENQRRASAKLAAIAETALGTAEQRFAELDGRRVAAQHELEDIRADSARTSEAAVLRVEVGRLAKAVEHQGDRLAKASSQYQQIALRASVVDRSLGVDFRIVDEQPPPPGRGLGGPLLGMVGLVLLTILVPLTAIAVAAFDKRIHDSADVTRLGLPILGRLAEPQESAKAILGRRG